MGKLIVGCGYLGLRLALKYAGEGVAVTGITRSAEGVARCVAAGIDARAVDLDAAVRLPFDASGAELFYLVPPPASGTADGRVGRFLAALGARPRRIVYLSTTGVYGDCGGAWIDETRPVAPGADRARRRWDAEERFRAWRRETGGELVILRVAGFYGPGRLPLERLKKRLPLVREEEAPFSNRIHVDDLVSAASAAMERGRDGEVYNVCDGHPTTMTDYFLRIAALTRLPAPPLISLAEARRELSPGMLSYMGESRRLSNAKMIRELGVELRYPTLAEGLPASL